MNPHDYYHSEHMELGSKGNGHPAIEPDWFPHAHGGSLPIVSTVGAGPRGASIHVKRVESEDGSYVLQFIDSLTGEVVETSPNLAAPEISIDYAPETTQAGQVTQMHVHVGEDEYTIPIQAGEAGSRIYVMKECVAYDSKNVYTCETSSLTISERELWESAPRPRPCDVVAFKYRDFDGYGLAFGIVQAVEGTTVTYTARTYIPMHMTESMRVDPPATLLDDCEIGEVKDKVNEIIATLQEAGVLKANSLGALLGDCEIGEVKDKINEIICSLQDAGVYNKE